MRSVSRQQCHSACLLLGKPGKAACDWQLGTQRMPSSRCSYPLLLAFRGAGCLFFFRRFRFFAQRSTSLSQTPAIDTFVGINQRVGYDAMMR